MSDTGSIVLGWLTKLADFTVADHANSAASVAADTYRTTKSGPDACLAAQAEATKNLDTLNCDDPKAFQVAPDGHVTLVLHRTATTLWMHRIGFLKKYTDLTGHGEGTPGP